MGVSPNILITNYCNQNCNFCFANELMNEDDDREMSMENFLDVLTFLKKNKVKRIYLMGGEPTLHTKFKELVDISLKNGFEVELFTNAEFSEDTERYLTDNSGKISMFHINIGTPKYRIDGSYEKTNSFIKEISKKTDISLEITIDSLDKNDLFSIIKKAEKILSLSMVRIGVNGGLINRGGFSVEKNLRMGKIIMEALDLLKKKKVKGIWLCEVNTCMFTDSQRRQIEESNLMHLSGYGCLSKRGAVDIKTDLRAIRCFGLDCLKGHRLDDSLENIKVKLDQEMVKKNKLNLPEECKKCKFFGVTGNKCPGPCLIGRI